MGCCESTPKPKPEKKIVPATAPLSTPKEPTRPSPSASELRAIKISEDKSLNPRCLLEGGVVTKCFPDGVVYRIQKGDKVYYYNESLDYLAHIVHEYDPLSKMMAGEMAKVEILENEWKKISLDLYPQETFLLAQGNYTDVKMSVTLEPLNAENMEKKVKEADKIINKEIDALTKIAKGETDMEELLKRCVQKNVMFVDLEFPPKQQSLSRPQIDNRELPPLPFMRPTQYLPEDICNQSDDIIGPVCPASIDRGYLGDCWVTCAMSIMANSELLIKQIFSHGNAKEKAVGAYRVLTYKNGWAQKLILDNYLPVTGSFPAFASVSDDPRELWVSLLQKAYAKVNGSFASITGGDVLHFIQDLTGAPTYRFDSEFSEAVKSSSKAEELFKTIIDSVSDSHTLVLSTPSKDDADMSKLDALDLRPGFSYLVDRVERVKKTLLFHVCNPWGLGKQWTGAWGQDAPQWKEDSEAKVRCKPSWNKLGEFWMAWEDITKHFNGGGFVFNFRSFYSYSIRGMFFNLIPTASLEVRASETTEVTLTLTQKDPRGLPVYETDAMLGAILLSVAEETEAGKQKVVQCTSANPLQPRSSDQEFSFVAGRSVSMTFTFQAGKTYYVIPRLHSGGMPPQHQREYVLSMGSSTSLKPRLRAVVKGIPAEARVFSNLVNFETKNATDVQAELQAVENFQLLHKVSNTVLSGSS